MPNLEQATQLFESLCNDDAHGYSQIDRWGEYSDFDCSSAIIYAFQQAGYPVYGGRHEGYTGSMAEAFAAIGFAVLPADVDLIRGDILLNVADHVALYLGDGLLGEFSQSEDGGIDGASGDQTGAEAYIHGYYDFPWDCVLRAPDDAAYPAGSLSPAANSADPSNPANPTGSLYPSASADGPSSPTAPTGSLSPSANPTAPTGSLPPFTNPDGTPWPRDPFADLPPRTDPLSIRYAAWTAEDGWLPAVTDFTDYAGAPGHPIRGLAIDLDGCGWYQVQTQDSGWLPAIRGCDAADWENGVAGDTSPITAVRVYYETADPRQTGWLAAAYQAAPLGGNFYPVQYDDNTGNGQDGYAGDAVTPMDRFRLRLE